MQPQKRMISMQRLFNPSQYRSSSLMTLNKENFARVMIESINKAMNSDECPAKEKHVRKLLIGSYQAESGSFFWEHLPVIRLKENKFVCWKFCHVLHRMLRDGHKQVLNSSHERRQILLDCGNMWRHVEDYYGRLIFNYCSLLYNRINFLMRNYQFPNDLKVNDEQLDEIGDQDPNVFFNLSCEIFDLLDDIIRLQKLVVEKIDLDKNSSLSTYSQCLLAPLIACTQDSSLLYDYSVKILFKLHSILPVSTLEGHRERFASQHESLWIFYSYAHNLQYFRMMIQVQELKQNPPDFLSASDFQKHVPPQVVLITRPEGDSPDQYFPQHDGNSDVLVNFNDDDEDDDIRSQSASYVETCNDGVIDSMDEPVQVSNEQFSLNESLQARNHDLLAKVNELESTMVKLSEKSRTMQADNLNVKEELENLKESHEVTIKNHAAEVRKFREEINSLKYQLNAFKGKLEDAQNECKRAQHDNEISQGVMRKLVKDLSDMKAENSNLLAGSRGNKQDKKLDEEVTALEKTVDELRSQLNEREAQCQEWVKEKELLQSSNVRLEKQLGDKQVDILMAEMNETDKIIKEAARMIDELTEKSRKFETGIKLQVSEKISEVCSNLMKAVRNLIIQSRLLQQEVVGSDNTIKVEEFYKRNSSWTEGLISAANVVAMAARSLVDSADRAMSGQAKFSELAAAAHEIAAATTQLVVASRVKANKDSEKLKILASVAKQVNQCSNNVVDTARVCGELIEQEVDKIDISSLSLHQTKKLEMETQVKLLELEDQLSKERIKLGLLRRQHYEQESNHLQQQQ